jgi:hypothetical protein
LLLYRNVCVENKKKQNAGSKADFLLTQMASEILQHDTDLDYVENLHLKIKNQQESYKILYDRYVLLYDEVSKLRADWASFQRYSSSL